MQHPNPTLKIGQLIPLATGQGIILGCYLGFLIRDALTWMNPYMAGTMAGLQGFFDPRGDHGLRFPLFGVIAGVVLAPVLCYCFRHREIHGVLAWIVWGAYWGIFFSPWFFLFVESVFNVPVGILLGSLAGMWVYLWQVAKYRRIQQPLDDSTSVDK